MNALRKGLFMAMGIALTGAYALPVDACETDEDCGPGFVCESFEYSEWDCAYPDFDCDEEDEECQAAWEEAMDSACEPGEVFTETYCGRAPCEEDADCGEDMVCVEYVEEWCSGSAYEECDDEGECEIIEEEMACGSEIYRECGYPYEGSCEVDSDCGEGFNCVAYEICSCTDSDDYWDDGDEDWGSGADEGEENGEPVTEVPLQEDDWFEENCTCELSDEKYCELQEIYCDTDTDCPDGMICSLSYGISECTETPDGDIICTNEETFSMCQPDTWDEDWDWDEVETGNTGDDAGGDMESDIDVDIDTDGDMESDIDIDIDTDGDDGGEEAGPGSPDGQGGWGWHPWAWCGGCSVVTPASGSASGLGMLGLMGLIMFALRRRR